jgi:osmotically inducible protein OsmC
MANVRSATAEWTGNLTAGKGRVTLESGAFDGSYDFSSRFETGSSTNPEELIAAAHAGCFSMALAHGLTSAGHPPNRITTKAKVHLEKREGAFVIPLIELETEGDVPGIDEHTFGQQAHTAKNGCPVSKALAGPKIRLTSARLVRS